LAALYVQAHPDRVERIVFLDPMPPALKPFAQEREDKMKSALGPERTARLRELARQHAAARDEDLPAICREMDPIFFQPYLVDPARYDRGRQGICEVPPAVIRNAIVVAASVNRSLGDFDLRRALANLTVPALVIEGKRTIVPLDATREWAKAPPDARLLLVAEAEHATFLDRPEAVIRAIEVFLGGEWPSAAKRVRRHAAPYRRPATSASLPRTRPEPASSRRGRGP